MRSRRRDGKVMTLRCLLPTWSRASICRGRFYTSGRPEVVRSSSSIDSLSTTTSHRHGQPPRPRREFRLSSPASCVPLRTCFTHAGRVSAPFNMEDISATQAEQFRLPTDVRPTHYDITIRTDLEKLSFEGFASIECALLLPPLSLEARAHATAHAVWTSSTKRRRLSSTRPTSTSATRPCTSGTSKPSRLTRPASLTPRPSARPSTLRPLSRLARRRSCASRSMVRSRTRSWATTARRTRSPGRRSTIRSPSSRYVAVAARTCLGSWRRGRPRPRAAHSPAGTSPH
jgi:hypothetical protein